MEKVKAIRKDSETSQPRSRKPARYQALRVPCEHEQPERSYARLEVMNQAVPTAEAYRQESHSSSAREQPPRRNDSTFDRKRRGEHPPRKDLEIRERPVA